MRASRLNSGRAKLLAASLTVFARKRFHQTAVSDIVDASKIGHGKWKRAVPMMIIDGLGAHPRG